MSVEHSKDSLKTQWDQCKEGCSYDLFSDSVMSILWYKDAQGRFLFVNKAFEDYTGIKREQIYNKLDNEISQLTREPLIWEGSDNIDFHEEKTVHSENGKKFYDVRVNAVKSDDGNIIGSAGVAFDITENKRMETLLLANEEKFLLFAENTSDAFIIKVPGYILYANKACENIFSQPVSEITSQKDVPITWIAKEDQAIVNEIRKNANFGQTNRYEAQYRLDNPDKKVIWLWERTFPVFDDKGSLLHIVSMFSDISQQKLLEHELINSKARQQAILDNIPHLAWLKDIRGRYISVNKAFADFYNLTPEQIIDKTDFDFCPSELAELYTYNDQRVIESRTQHRSEESFDNQDSTIYAETIKTPVIGPNQELIGITGISRDISRFKQLEQQLRDNDERLQALLRHLPDAITVLNKDGTIQYDSSLLSLLTGNSPDELKKMEFVDLAIQEDKGFVRKALRKILAQPDVYETIEFRCINKNGSAIYLESIFSNHLDNPLLKSIVVNSRDITERKIAELKEKQYQENLVFLESTAVEFLSLSNSDEIYHFIGQKIHELIHESVILISTYKEAEDILKVRNITGIEKYFGIVLEFLGKDPIGFSIPMTNQLRKEILNSANNLVELKGGLYRISEKHIPQLACTALERMISMNKLYGMGLAKSGKFLGSIIIMTRFENEIPDKRIIEAFICQASVALQRRKLEKELIVAKEKAEESDRLKSAFLANISHEIRTPLNGIIGFTQLLDTIGLEEDKRSEFIEIIKLNSNQLVSLIDDIINISAIEEGQLTIKNQLININRLFDEIGSSFLSPAYKKLGKDVTFQMEKGLPDEEAILFSDPFRIRQVLGNLIGNAFKFTYEGLITLGYKKKNGNIYFYVKDTGIGVSQEKQAIIFERFMQGDSSYSRRHGGSGLGLAISKGLVELMGGTIGLHSEPDKGSEFWFMLPSKANGNNHVTEVTEKKNRVQATGISN